MRYGAALFIGALLLLVGCIQSTPPNVPVACTADAKLCLDGSYVGRVPPSCEFAPCPAAPSPITIQSPPEFQGALNQYFSESFSASGGTPPYAWSVSRGTLPPGLQLDKAVSPCLVAPCDRTHQTTAELFGAPSVSGSYEFDLTATDASGKKAVKSITVTISASSPPAQQSIVYGDDASRIEEYRADCASKGGTFDDCGSACPNAPPGTSCIQVCVMGCTIP